MSKKPKVFAHSMVRLLKLIDQDDKTQTEYAKHLGWTRFKVAYNTKKLLKEKMIVRIKNSQFYKSTLTGATFLHEYESNHKKSRIGIENYRWKVRIRNSKQLNKFILTYGFKHNQMNNWDQWIGSIDGFTIWLNLGKETNMVIGHPKVFGDDFITKLKEAEQSIINVVDNLDKKWSFDFGTIQNIPRGRQITFSDPFAEDLMNRTNGSQIKLDNGKVVFDQSNQTEPRIEFEELTDAVKYANMPNEVHELSTHLKTMSNDMKTMGEAMVDMKNLFQQLINPNAPDPKNPTKVIDLNDDQKRMFG